MEQILCTNLLTRVNEGLAYPKDSKSRDMNFGKGSKPSGNLTASYIREAPRIQKPTSLAGIEQSLTYGCVMCK